MTIKEITALRKSGQLDRALEAAEAEFARNGNKYIASALFWCLNALYRNQTHDDAVATVGRMKSLYEDYCAGDTLMQRSLAIAESICLPHFQEIKEAVAKAKNGNGEAAKALYPSILSVFEAGQLDERLYSEFGWLIYYALKHTPLNDAPRRKAMLAAYLKLDLSKTQPLLHSLILEEAVKVEKNTPLQFRIRDFMNLWGFENLRDGDWNQFRTDDGKTLPSLVEKLIGVYAKELKTDNVAAPKEFSDLVDQALTMYPSSQNMPYFKAIVLMSQGRREEAIEYYRDLLLRFPSKYYLWQQTAQLVDDLDTRIGLLSKALALGGNEQFLGGVRLAMAGLLIAKGDTPHACYELDRYSDLYRSNGWNLKGEYWTLRNRIGNVEAAADNREVYALYARKADEFVYSHLPEQIAVKVAEKQIEDKNRPGRMILSWTMRIKDGVLHLKKPTKFGLDRKDPCGTVYSVRTREGKIAWIKRLDAIPALDWLKRAEGTVRIRNNKAGKRFAFIDDVYLGENLIASFSEGDRVGIVAVKQEDGRWRALSVTKLSR